MIRKLLATTALATLVASGAYAQDATQPAQTAPSTTQAPMSQPETPMVIKAEGNLASNVIGKAVYNGTGQDAKKIGSVNDLVLSPDGQVQALVIGVGGFLGIGQKDVAIEYNLAKWEERDNDRWLVVETTAEALKAQPEFDKQAYQPMPADADVAETKPATAEDLAKAPVEAASTEQQPAADSNQMAAAPTTDQPAASTSTEQTAQAPATTTDGTASQDQTASTEQKPADQAASTDQTAAADQKPADQAASGTDQQTAQAPTATDNATDNTQTAAIDRSTLKDQPIDQIRADDFIGTTIYGADDAKVGEVGDVVLSQDGKVDAVLVDVGGFLGMGEKEVALGMDNLHFMTDENGKLYLYTSLTKDALEAQPAYEEGSYADNRDKMRMNVPAAN
ncbi:MAG: PRC-barrel domain-containing protein [Rhizobiales bacterium]|mgnify:CR=1 FL=1|jgi:sporulation protein YlmC with PRC-barrel domain|nr:PRC-barrel domain-containing protein [Hyphomicrobiales bacterium]OJU35163.1 MAG: photosystem reaction center subunit H [Rhizobiales bacterium 68-8]